MQRVIYERVVVTVSERWSVTSDADTPALPQGACVKHKRKARPGASRKRAPRGGRQQASPPAPAPAADAADFNKEGAQ